MSKKTPTLDKDAVEVDDKVELTLAQDAVLDDSNSRSREEIMDSIVEKRNAEVDSEIALDVEDVKPEKIAVKINGEESKVTPEEIREYQKKRAADDQFRAVAKDKKELAEREKAFAARESAFSKERAKVMAVPKVEPNADLDSQAEDLITSVFAEDTDGVKKVLAKMRLAPVAPVTQAGVSEKDIEHAITQRERRIELQKAVKRFDTDYSELKDFRDDVDKRTIIEQKEDPDATPWDIIDRSAKHVRNSMAAIFEKSKESASKRGATPIRSTVTRRFVAPVPKESGATPFEEIAAARGQ